MKAYSIIKRIIKALVFVCIIVVMCYAFSVLSLKNKKESIQLLKQNIENAVTDCYAIEGMYPPDFEYLEKNYGFKIDETKYYVDYQVFGSNIRPVIQLLEIGNRVEKGGFYD